jgi:hypothetical protein
METLDRTPGIVLSLAAAMVSGIAVFVHSYGVRGRPGRDAFLHTRTAAGAVP